VPLIIGGGILVAGLTIFIILRRDKWKIQQNILS
jgi:hypothetical protein